jgi:hypothetical protein
VKVTKTKAAIVALYCAIIVQGTYLTLRAMQDGEWFAVGYGAVTAVVLCWCIPMIWSDDL